jgi:DNA-binding MarR family transcriptional regulator
MKQHEVAKRVADDLGPRLSNATIFFHEAVSAQLGLNATDTKCIGLLSRANGHMTAGELADLTTLTTGAVTAIIDRLEAAGLVRRRRDARDRRKVFVELQHDRMKQVNPLYSRLRDSINTLVSTYNDAELATIADFLEKSSRILHREAQKLSRQRKMVRRSKNLRKL